jgi:PiT family inorganic phosphate transporter
MDTALIVLVLTLIFCYIYAFISGFTDSANAIATSVGSRSLSPTFAVIMAGVLELVGALTGTAVALMIGKGIVSLDMISPVTVLAALCAAMSWSILTYFYGIPVSETHGLVGAIIGATLAFAAPSAIIWSGLWKILIAIILSPVLGFIGGAVLMSIIYALFANAPSHKMTKLFKNLQRFSAAFMAFSHGKNDAQKPMGILVMALALYFGWKDPSVPLWVILSVGLTAGIGVAYGGWKIIKTIGMRVTSLSPAQGFAAETSSAGVMSIASVFGIPVSTTHTITSSIVGAGAIKRLSSVHWDVFFDIVISWVVTLPITIFSGYLFGKILGWIFVGV